MFPPVQTSPAQQCMSSVAFLLDYIQSSWYMLAQMQPIKELIWQSHLLYSMPATGWSSRWVLLLLCFVCLTLDSPQKVLGTEPLHG